MLSCTGLDSTLKPDLVLFGTDKPSPVTAMLKWTKVKCTDVRPDVLVCCANWDPEN